MKPTPGTRFSVTQRLDSPNWGAFLENLTRDYTDLLVRIEVLEPSAAEHLKTPWFSMRGIIFDARHNQIDILVDSLDHRISNPTAMFARTRGGRIECLEILDEGNRRQLVRFKQKRTYRGKKAPAIQR